MIKYWASLNIMGQKKPHSLLLTIHNFRSYFYKRKLFNKIVVLSSAFSLPNFVVVMIKYKRFLWALEFHPYMIVLLHIRLMRRNQRKIHSYFPIYPSFCCVSLCQNLKIWITCAVAPNKGGGSHLWSYKSFMVDVVVESSLLA